MSDKFLHPSELIKDEHNFSTLCVELLKRQKEEWDLCKNGFASLESVQTKIFEFDGFTTAVQFNPGRITSSAAKVDPESIKKRKCFLCLENLPEAQKGILYNQDYVILCNPFPIFKEHFTIPHVRHIPQSMNSDTFEKLLSLAKDLSERHLVFYNGPKCGASAPDHLHFQAGEKAFLPIYKEFQSILKNKAESLYQNSSIDISIVRNIYRNLFVIRSSSSSKAKEYFFYLLEAWKNISNPNADEEPLINVIAWHENQSWTILFIPRAKHRPACYFAEGDDNILLSPASVDIGGICITPLEKDFVKITKDDIVKIYKEVCVDDNTISSIADKFLEKAKAA